MTGAAYASCRLCPRACGVDRTRGETGFCGQTDTLYAAKAYLHLWEEPCLQGENGSGTVFFCGCNLRCVYCQNAEISRSSAAGKPLTAEKLSEVYLSLQEKGAANVNLVTPTHFLPHILESVRLARKRGLSIPFVYNTSGYERVESLRQLDGQMQIYLTDLKYHAPAYARKYSHAPDYFSFAFAAAEEMFRQRGALTFDQNGVLQSGVIVRHLVLPDMIMDAKRILSALYSAFGNRILYSIMRQYTPVHIPQSCAELNRPVTEREYAEVVDYARAIGIENAYIQPESSSDTRFIPQFDREGL